MSPIFDFPVTSLDGVEGTLAPYRGKVLLIVNVASACRYTPQYSGLETLYRDLGARGLAVLGFPCNQFGEQELGDAAAIAEFCSQTYDVSFPIFAKVKVNGPRAHPLFVHLKSEKRGLLGTASIKWNFTKFLVARDGRVVQRFAPTDTPKRIRARVESLLAI